MPAPSPLRLTRRAALHATTAALAAGAAPWALAQEDTTKAAQQPAAPATLQIVGPWEFTSLSPASSGYMLLNLQVCETLVGADDHGRPQPALAQRWKVSADGLAWHFTLRPGARFHDGSRATAAVVVQSLQRAQKAPALLSNAPIASITAEGDGEVLIRLSRPHNALAAQLAHYSTLVLAPESYGADGKVQRIIGTGPYRITKLVPPQQVETEAFDNYERPASTPAPAVRSVAYMAVTRAETRALMVEGSQAHLAYGLDPASLRRLRRHAKVGIASVTLPRTVIVKLNAALPGLQDVRVRQALILSIDRAGIAHALMGDEALAATQLLPPPWPTGITPPCPRCATTPKQPNAYCAKRAGSATAMACAGPMGSRWCCPSAPF